MNLFQKTITLLAVLALSYSYSFSQSFKADQKATSVKWFAEKVTGAHDGSISIKSGSLKVDNGKITGGEFEIDMTSITCADIENAEYNAKLVGHLKSEDFFNVDKHKTAKLVITKVTQKKGDIHYFRGNLTIKGITKEIKFEAKVSNGGDKITATGTIVLDRTDFDVKYSSGSFFENLGDKVIYDEFKIEVSLTANKS